MMLSYICFPFWAGLGGAGWVAPEGFTLGGLRSLGTFLCNEFVQLFPKRKEIRLHWISAIVFDTWQIILGTFCTIFPFYLFLLPWCKSLPQNKTSAWCTLKIRFVLRMIKFVSITCQTSVLKRISYNQRRKRVPSMSIGCFSLLPS
jgi:hypothetical protein